MPAAHRRPDARRLIGIDHVHVKRDVHERRARGDPDRMLHHVMHAVPVDVVHREHGHARIAQMLTLARIDRTHPDEHRVLRQDRRHRPRIGREPRVVGQPQRHRQRHPVHVAARRTRRRVDIRVGIHPDHASGSTVSPRQAAQRADRDRVVAAQHQRYLAGRDHIGHLAGKLFTGRLDRVPVARLRIALIEPLERGCAHIAAVGWPAAERLEPLGQAAVADRRGAHVDTTPPRTQVKRSPDHADRNLGLWGAHAADTLPRPELTTAKGVLADADTGTTPVLFFAPGLSQEATVR